MPHSTLYAMFLETVAQHGTKNAVGFKASRRDTEHTYYTYQDLALRVRSFRRGLNALGLQKGDAVALLSENRVEWAITDLAAQALGLINVAPYATLPAEQVAFILHDSGAKVIVVSDKKQLEKILQTRDQLPDLKQIIVIDPREIPESVENLLTFEEVYRMGEASGRSDADLDAIASTIKAEDVATYIYTSGTTGEPKGAMLTQANLLQTPDAVAEHKLADINSSDVFLSFLPLSHITERVGGHYLPLRVGACIVYSKGLLALTDEIQKEVRPTVMLCVPRLWESIYDKAKANIASRPEGIRGRVRDALDLAKEAYLLREAGKSPGLLKRLKLWSFERLILSRLREKTTGGRLRFAISGGAPLDPDTATFFLSIGIQMLEGYGLSETSIISINRPKKQKVGSVGTLLPNTELKIAEDGEILMRGQGRMKGYHNRPTDTSASINSDGWFLTGDIGELVGGYLTITDRKKDLLVLSNGKKVAPQPIETNLKHSDWISEAVLFGDKQPTVCALIVPNFDKLTKWARAEQLPMEMEALVNHPMTIKIVKGEIDRVCKKLPDYERVKNFRILAKPFTLEAEELTPTLKVRRKVVAEHYAVLINEMSR